MASSKKPRVSSTDDVLNLDVDGSLGSLGVGLDELDSEDVTLVGFVIDMSSSMGGVTDAVIHAYNTELQALRTARTASSILVSTTTFADQPGLLHGYLKLDRVPLLDHATYLPNGCTALHDAVLGVLDRLESYRGMLRDNGVRSRGVVIVLSDGDDNHSQKGADDVRREAERLVREEAITLAYVGFGSADLRAIAARIGFPHVLTANQTASEIRRVLGQLSASILRTSSRKQGAGSAFF
jgi:hypothetical protein